MSDGRIGAPRLPAAITATSEAIAFESADEVWLLRDLDLSALVQLVDGRHPRLGIDIDSVEGLNADSAGVRFVVSTLGMEMVVSRRSSVALEAAEFGCLGMLRVFAFDSTGLRRSLDPIAAHELPGIGTVISPGLVLPHIEPAQVALLTRPLAAYGLIESPDQVRALLRDADCVVIRPDVAARVRAAEPKLLRPEP